MSLEEELRDVIEKSHGNLDEIEVTKGLGSDRFESGTEYDIYGQYIPVRPILLYIEKQPEVRLESISFIDEGEQAHLTLFVPDDQYENEIFI